MKITLKQLKEKRACNLALFKKVFGASVEITEKNCLIAVKAGMDLNWAAENFFRASAGEAYEKARAPAFYKASLRRR